MEPKPYPAPPDVEYTLDTACDMDEIDPTTVATLKLYGDRNELMRWADMNSDEISPEAVAAVAARGYRRRLRQKAKYLAYVGAADEILRQLPPERLGALLYLTYQGLGARIAGYANFRATWAIVDACEGGCELPFRNRPIMRPGPRLMGHLRSWKFIRRYVHGDVDLPALRLDIEHLVARMAMVPMERIRLEGHEDEGSIAYDLRQQYVRQGHAYDRAAYEADMWQRLQQRRFPWEGSPPPRTRRERKKQRKTAVRSLRAAAAVVGPEDAARLARGEAIVVVGAETSLRLQRNLSIMDKDHGCLDVDLLTHDGQKLADLCVYVKDTPTLDQAAGMALFFQSGDERELIGAANIIRTTPLGETHSALEPIRQRQVTQRARRVRVPNDIAEARNHAYWQETRPKWIMAVGTYLLGSRGPQMRFLQGL
jgi:hypothetical protein